MSTPHRYYGLSTDIKPIPGGPDVAVGSPARLDLFVEQDTGRSFYFDGTSWLPQGPFPTTSLDQVSAQLTRTNELLEAILFLLAHS